MFGLLLILLTTILAALAYLFSPDNSPFANTMHLEIATQKPGFEVQILHLPKKQTKQISFFNTLLQGSPNKTREIPISEIDHSKCAIAPLLQI